MRKTFGLKASSRGQRAFTLKAANYGGVRHQNHSQGENMEVLGELEELVSQGSNERKIQALLKSNLELFGKYFSHPENEYIVFSEFPFGQGTCDVVVFTDRSRMDLIAIELKGADFNFSTSNEQISSEIHFAAQQIRDRFSHIDSNRESFRRDAHEIRKKVESGVKLYNSKVGPKGSLLVDPLKEITWRGVVIGGVARDDDFESKEKTKLELNASPRIKYESWTSFIRKLKPRDTSVDPMESIHKYHNEKQGNPIALGSKVRSKTEWPSVPAGTLGLVDEHYQGMDGVGVMIAWDLSDRPLPDGYSEHDSENPIRGILRDGFSASEAKYLEVVEA